MVLAHGHRHQCFVLNVTPMVGHTVEDAMEDMKAKITAMFRDAAAERERREEYERAKRREAEQLERDRMLRDDVPRARKWLDDVFMDVARHAANDCSTTFRMEVPCVVSVRAVCYVINVEYFGGDRWDCMLAGGGLSIRV